MDNENVPKTDIDFSSRFAVGVCVRYEPAAVVSMPECIELFGWIAECFSAAGIGNEFDRNADEIRILCSFNLVDRDSFPDLYIKPTLLKIERDLSYKCIYGIGLIAANRLHIEESLQTSSEACDMYFFEEGRFFEYQKIKRPYSISFDEYESRSEEAFKAILTKQPDTLDKIGRCLDLIRDIHYGNKQAVIMRAMNFTGELASRLHRYNLLGTDFYKMQDKLQEKVLVSVTFPELRETIMAYYRSLLADINSRSRTGRKTMVEQVKTYIRENYMEDISAEDLAAIACVSPGYFSHMFKNVTGQSYKAFLTDVRINAAVELLLSSDLRLYEISEKVGYNNVRNFTEAFTKKYNVAPGEYRKQYQKL